MKGTKEFQPTVSDIAIREQAIIFVYRLEVHRMLNADEVIQQAAKFEEYLKNGYTAGSKESTGSSEAL